MKISDLEFFQLELPRTAPQPGLRTTLIRLATDSGAEGWGEAATRWRPAELPGRRESLMSALVGRGVFEIEELLGLDSLADPGLRWAVEMASWDLIARDAGQPLCHLLGGMFRNRIPLAVRLPDQPGADIPQLAREWAEHGFHSLIYTARGEVAEDRDAVLTLSQAIAGRAELIFDGGAKYRLETATEIGSQLTGDQARYFRDPLPRADVAELAALGSRVNVPLAVSRGLSCPRDVFEVAVAQAASYAVVAPNRVGGLQAARRCAAVAEAADISASLSVTDSAGLAIAAMLHLAAATPSFASGNECDYHQLQDDALTEPLELIDGMLSVPQTPGLGVEVDRAKLERYQVG